MADDIVIVGATRTRVGHSRGVLNLSAHELGQIVIKAALERDGIEGSASPKSLWARSSPAAKARTRRARRRSVREFRWKARPGAQPASWLLRICRTR